MSSLPRLLVFTSSTCQECKSLKSYLIEKGLIEQSPEESGDYAVLNISENPAHRKLLMSKAILKVPALIFDNEVTIVGFDKTKIDEVIDSIIGPISI